RHKLALQVTAKNGFLANAGRDGERDPQDRFEQALRSKSARRFGQSRRMNKPGNDAENEDCGDPKSESYSDIEEKSGGARPAFTGDVSNGFSAAASAAIHDSHQPPFPGHSGSI